MSGIHGECTFRLTQMLFGHGAFSSYAYRIGKAESPICTFCSLDMDTNHHTLEDCSQWNEERKILKTRLEIDTNEQISLEMVIGISITNSSKWDAFTHFCELVMTRKEEREREEERMRLRLSPAPSPSSPSSI